ncbi:MAG: 30S ribosomal protein S8 [Patescibacteria group bacterium]
MTDKITDMLNRIKNAQAVNHKTVEMPFSKFKFAVAKVLETNGFIGKIEKKGRKTKKVLEIVLKYNDDKTPAMNGFKKISKPGQRIYQSHTEINRVKSGLGKAVVSTSKGLLIDDQVRFRKIGGEVLFHIW